MSRPALRASRVALAAAFVASAAPSALAQQAVLLDFSRTGGADFVFTMADRDALQAEIAADFRAFNFSFTQSTPTSGPFSTIFFNDGSTPTFASKTDFRNVDKADFGRVQTSADFASFGGTGITPEVQRANFLQFTANLASRTIGQLVGLDTFDSLGPLGQGLDPDMGFLVDPATVAELPLPASSSFSRYQFSPSATIPTAGTETSFHLSESRIAFVDAVFELDPVTMEPVIDPITMRPIVVTPAGYVREAGKRAVEPTSGQVIDQYFGPREAIKLSFNERGSVIPELANSGKQTVQRGTLNVPVQPIALVSLSVPTTATRGPLARQVIDADALVVTGRLVTGTERDLYAITGSAGDLLNIEIKSDVFDSGREPTPIDSIVSVLDSNFQPISYAGGAATNDDELVSVISRINASTGAKVDFPSTDSRLIDLTLASTGTFYIEVRSFGNTDSGDYELFVSRASTVTATVGDFNIDGVVDAADYTLWRDTFDDDVPPNTGADADGNGKIDVLDYNKWRSNYGRRAFAVSSSASASAATPEPTAAVVAFAGLALAAARGRRG